MKFVSNLQVSVTKTHTRVSAYRSRLAEKVSRLDYQLMVYTHCYRYWAPIATDASASGPSVCLFVTLVHPAKAVGRNEVRVWQGH